MRKASDPLGRVSPWVKSTHGLWCDRHITAIRDNGDEIQKNADCEQAQR